MDDDVSRETSPPRSRRTSLQLGAFDASLERFAHLVVTEARPRRLVGFSDAGVRREIRRSLLLLGLFGFSGRVIDVGSGAGFPGIALAICRGEVVLIEPRRKAVAFLERVKRELGLKVEIVQSNAEEAGRSVWGGSGDFVVARAVAPLGASAGLCTPLCRIGGKVVITAAPSSELHEDPVNPGPRFKKFERLSALSSLTLSDGLELSQQVHIMRRLS